MLKALELSGFKSFADRTRFEFPRGISVVVGPNGSGKSNLVDAVKWVLGSQSAKSLRGKEMIDVIFNGCATRGPLGTGEVTLTLDNEHGLLPIEAKEVHLTRRVYRSGEGEYLINRQPCRLRDMRELLAGTGITTEAYCIIEQGKVDALLQASPRDRRIIFEEAAGISQFKHKKAAAARRMERVEQNLLRLSDIVDEVESRLRSVRMQAGKARRYRECMERLQQLRTEVGLVDWRALTRQISAREEQLAELRRQVEERNQAVDQAEAALSELESRAEAMVRSLRELELAASAVREQIAARRASVESQAARRDDLRGEIARTRQQLTAMAENDAGNSDSYRAAAEQLQAAETELAAANEKWRGCALELEQAQREWSELQVVVEQMRSNLAEATRRTEALAEKKEALRGQLAFAVESVRHRRKELTELAARREAAVVELARYEAEESQCAARLESHQATLATSEGRLASIRRELARADKQQREVEVRLTRIHERINVLTEVEQMPERQGETQDSFRLAREATDGSLGEVHGVVADVVHVDVDTAPLVEMALGEQAQFVVVSSYAELLKRLENQPLGVRGRVGFLSLEGRAGRTALDHLDLSAEDGVMGRADRFVECDPRFAPLVQRLLGRTWLVDRLATALRLSRTTGRGLSFVTVAGELLTADGTIVVGPTAQVGDTSALECNSTVPPRGILSRRSEMRACQEQLFELEEQLREQTALRDHLDQKRAQQETELATSIAAYAAVAKELTDCRDRTARCRAQVDSLTVELRRLEHQLQEWESQIAAAEAALEDTQRQQADGQTTAATTAARLSELEQQAAELSERAEALKRAARDSQISAAKCEQRVEMLRQQVEQAQRSVQERQRALDEMRQLLADRESQAIELEKAILAGQQTLTELQLRKEQQSQELAKLAAAEETLRSERVSLTEQLRDARQQLTTLQSQQHRLEVAVSRLRHERQTLCDRMREDYGIDLEQQATNNPQPASGEHGDAARAADLGDGKESRSSQINRDAVEREIEELRNQINNIGAINLEALDELEQLESRFQKLSEQYRDLVEAKASLERVIQRINIDSRQLFVATLEAVRGHFQELFRRLFGGGEANIVLDESEDILECGIEIVARPPGKEACNISLLSGGEKTLTCVALLLAVFRSKPSPFCILDEVDAALDEANIGRFIAVLRDFLSFTQFIVVTHSKQTMAGADTLYGVTMEESGVSKRVSVRFEDVTEDGHILPSALRRGETPHQPGTSNDDPNAQRRAA